VTIQAESVDLGALLRSLRRRADLSQRELAVRAGVPKSTISRIEAGRARDPKFRTVARLVSAAGGTLGLGEVPPDPHGDRRDEGGRRYPAHLDVRDVHGPKDWPGAWWAYWYNLPPERWPLKVPSATYDLSRERRDRRRWREDVRDRVRVRAVEEDLPPDGWQWVAELPDGELVGDLRAHLRGRRPGGFGWAADEVDEVDDVAEVDREVVLDGVVVAAECRGLGIGRRLLAELLAEMDRSGIVVAQAITEFDGAEFLIRCGFLPEPSRPLRLTLHRPG
jgi:transcriptional regulator with XRE-family HTH domain